MKQFYSIAELASANLPDLPRTEKSLDNLARSSWRADPNTARRVPGKTKPVWEYHVSLLPSAAQMRLLIVHSAPANDDRDLKAERRRVLWDRYEKLSAEHKASCERRLKALQMAAELGFDDQEAARQHARKRRDYQKAIAAEKAAHTALTAGQLADILKRGEPSTAQARTPVRSKVTRLATGNLAVQMPAPSDEHAFEDSFSRALSRVGGERAVLEFPRGDRSAK